VGISVFNADDYFLVSGTLLLFLDSGSTQVTGAVTKNTLAAPAPYVKQTISQSHDGSIAASIITSSQHNYIISGYVNTSHGKVTTTLTQQVVFSNRQQFTINASEFVQNITQGTEVSTVTRTQGGTSPTIAERHYTYPLLLDIDVAVNSDGSAAQTTTVTQTFTNNGSRIGGGAPPLIDSTSQTEKSHDTLLISASDQVTGFKNRASSQSFFEESTAGLCYSRSLASRSGVLTAIEEGEGCKGGVNSF
jgi:Peptide N-acetyl-beta-D-glucosaminyl asparaginase amidase A